MNVGLYIYVMNIQNYWIFMKHRHAGGKMIEVRIQVLVLWNVAEGTRGHIGHAQIQHQG